MSFPNDFDDRMRNELGADYHDFIQSLIQPPETSIRLNPAKPTRAFDQLEEVKWHPLGRYLPERPVFTMDPLWHAGAYYVQEASSMFTLEAFRQLIGLSNDLRVLDLCAAPGGKTTLLASALTDNSLVLANEAIRTRVPALLENVEKWGYPNVMVSNHDPEEFHGMAGFFDVVLVDAPCSGEGLFRKDKAASDHWSLSNTVLCSARQKRILAASIPLLKNDGILIYSTCTFNRAENDENVKWLIDQFGLEMENLDIMPEWGIQDTGFGYQFYPHKVRGEGFFIACLRRTIKVQSIEKVAKSNPLRKLAPAQKAKVSNWLNAPEKNEFFIKGNGDIIAIPMENLPHQLLVAESLSRHSIGVEIGIIKQTDFIPSHKLALSNLVNPSLPSKELSREDALLFLKKQNIHFDDLQKGWVIARYQGLNLGWMKVLDNRTNNYLPTERKIRMDIIIE